MAEQTLFILYVRVRYTIYAMLMKFRKMCIQKLTAYGRGRCYCVRVSVCICRPIELMLLVHTRINLHDEHKMVF